MESGLHRACAIIVQMDRAAAIAKLKEHEAELKQLGFEHLFLFGSTAMHAVIPILICSLIILWDRWGFMN
jgi:hypothetical protein